MTTLAGDKSIDDQAVRILAVETLTRNVRRYRIERPEGFVFQPGQATELSLDLPEWRDKRHPFTLTGLTAAPDLEFIIKSYFGTIGDHVTERLWGAVPGDRLVIGKPWGTIFYKGPGVFLAGGTGITPFIAILRDLNANGTIVGNHLVASYRTSEDIILRRELEEMQGLACTWTVTAEPSVDPVMHDAIGADFLRRHVDLGAKHFYLCGPDPMVRKLRSILEGLGIRPDSLTWEK